MSVALFEGHPICYLYFMLDQSSFAQVQVVACKQVFPFEQQFSGLFLLWFGPLFEALEVQGLQDPSLLGFVIGFFGSPHWEDHWWHLVCRCCLSNHSLGGHFHGMGTYVAQTNRYPWEPQMWFPIGHHQYYHCRQLGTWHQFCEHVSPHKCPLTLELVCTLTVLNRGMVTFHVVRTGPLTSLRQNSLTSMGSPLGVEWITSFSTLVSFGLVPVSCSNPDMTAPKWACLHIVVGFISPP